MKGICRMSRLRNVASYLVIFLTVYVATSPICVQAAFTETVSGRVVDEWEQGMGNVEIEVYSSEGAFVKSESPSSDGYFDIWLDLGKSCVLHFLREGYVEVTKTASLWFGGGKVNLGDVVLLKALRLSSPVLSRVANPGDRLTLSFTVSNIGEDSEIVEFLVTKPEGWSTRIIDQIGEVAKICMSPGASMSLQLEVAIPVASTGNNSVSLTAAGKTSSTLDFTVKVETSTKSMVSCQFPGKSAAPGETVRFQVGVRNPFGVKLRFGVAVDSVPSGWMALVKSDGGEAVTEVTLDGNEFADLSVEVYVPREEVDGDYEVVFKALSSAAAEDLTLLVVVEKIAAGIGVDLLAIPPYLDAYAGSRAKFGLKLTNGGGYDQLFDLEVQGLPQNLRAWFEGSGGIEMTRVYVDAGVSKEFDLFVAIPRETVLGVSNFIASAASASVTKSVALTLNVLGLYKIQVTNQNFYVNVIVGEGADYRLIVRNTGTEVVTNLDATTTDGIPSGFAVDVTPTVLSSLRPDEEATFTITVTTQPDVNAGNYYVDFKVQSDQTEPTEFSLQIGVEQQMSWIYIGGGLVVVAVTVLFIVFRKFGRR
jgi:uncharacterized membrane protein